MKNVKVLDCTLRDGGRIIDCKFNDKQIQRMIYSMQDAGLDIIEVGFLRDVNCVKYRGNSTFFNSTRDISKFIPEHRKAQFVAFVDMGMYDVELLEVYDGNSIDGIRFGFTKKDFELSFDKIVQSAKVIKEKGYRLFMQGVNSLNYSDLELLRIVEMINKINPYSFGIVDTYGAMYNDDIQRLYTLIDHNLNSNIAIDFHSHNNMQLSFSFAQDIIRLSNGVRNIIIDGTLRGMGKGAGNLNTELLVDFLSRKKGYEYDLEKIMEIIDLELYDLFESKHWGYSPAAFMAGIYKSHPNNISYLLDKYNYSTNDIRCILTKLTDAERERYDYEKLDKLCEEHKYHDYDDERVISEIKNIILGKEVLVLAPGKSIVEQKTKIDEYIEKNNPIVFTVNFFMNEQSIVFFGNKKRYFTFMYDALPLVIITSDILSEKKNELVVSAKRVKELCQYNEEQMESSLFKLLNLLADLGCNHIAVAGMDGYGTDNIDNYYDSTLVVKRTVKEIEYTNYRLQNELSMFIKKWSDKCRLKIITKSVYKISL